MTAPMTSREELPSEASLKFSNELDDEMRGGLGIGELALRLEKFAARFNAPAQNAWQPIETAPKDGTRLLGYWAPFQSGAAEATDTVCWCDGDWCDPDDTEAKYGPPTQWMPLPAPPSTVPSTGLPAPAPHAEVRESDLYKLRDLIASHFACEDDCQKYPSGCGCALTAARAVQELGGK